MSIDRRQVLLSATAFAVAGGARAATQAGTAEAKLTARLDQLGKTLLNRSPELATGLGLDKGANVGLKSQLSDVSWSAVESLTRLCREELTALRAIPDAALSHEAKINKAVAVYALELGVEAAPFNFGDNTMLSAMNESAGPYVVSQQDGAYSGMAEFLDSQHQINTKADADAYLARLHAMSRVLDQETDRLRRDAGLGVTAPDFIAQNMLGQMDGVLAVAAAESRFVTSVAGRARAKGIAGDYTALATKIVETEIYPALNRQRDVLRANAASAVHDAGVWRLKDGEAYYAWLLKQGTNTTLSAQEVHQMGLDQNRAIEARMDSVLRVHGLTQGSVSERMIALSNDPTHLFPDTEAGKVEVINYLNGIIAGCARTWPVSST